MTRRDAGDGRGSGAWRVRVAVFLALASLALALLLGGPAAPGAEHRGIVSVLPPAVALALAFLTREVMSSLLVGIVLGAVAARRWDVVGAYIIPSVGTPSFGLILVVYLWLLGGLIGLWSRTGGAHAFAAWAGRRVIRGPRTAKLFAWTMGLLFHQGGTISAILSGTTVRPILDGRRVSHEEGSYIVDATASPVASLIPLNVWPIYVGGLIAGTTPLFATQGEAVAFYFRNLPLNAYGIVVVLLTLLFALEWLPWEGRRMREARGRARETGKLDGPAARPLVSRELETTRVPRGYRPGVEDFLLPLAVLLGVAATGVAPALLAGDIARIDVPIAQAFGLAVLAAFLLALAKGLGLQEAVDGFVDGVKGVTVGALLLALAVTLGEVAKDLGTAAYMVEATAEWIRPALLPLLLFLVAMAVSFATGMSWGTYPVTFPIAMPLAYAVHPDPAYVGLCFGAVLGGGVFGDHCSPLSDTTILSALSTGTDLMDHTLTQLPLGLLSAGISAALFLALGLALG